MMQAESESDAVRDIAGETVAGFRVAAYRETHPLHGAEFGHKYSEHWSTPSRNPDVKVERLFTEAQLREALAARAVFIPDAARDYSCLQGQPCKNPRDCDNPECAVSIPDAGAEDVERRDIIRALADLVQAMLDNDPDEPISDAGHCMLDLWRHDAKPILADARAALATRTYSIEDVERVARALCVLDKYDPDEIGDTHDCGVPKDWPLWRVYESNARADRLAAELAEAKAAGREEGLREAAGIADDIVAPGNEVPTRSLARAQKRVAAAIRAHLSAEPAADKEARNDAP